MKTNKLCMKGVLIAALIVLGAANVMAQVTPPDEDFEVTQNKDGRTLTISGYKGSARNISIPATLYGLPVTVIGKRAFYQKGLTGVVIPEGVITIEDGGGWMGAFTGNSLTSVTIPNSVVTIGNDAFGFNQLTRVIIGNNVTTIGDSAFSNNQLTSLTLGNKVITIGQNAFFSSRLTSVVIPDSVTTIKAGAFCSNQLTSVILGKSVRTIGGFSSSSGPYGAFTGNKLTSITIPDSVTGIETGAFWDNPLSSLILGRGLTSIRNRAFSGNQLASITITKDVTYHDNDFAGISTQAGFEEGFINFYTSQGRTPGTYVKNGPIWSKSSGNTAAKSVTQNSQGTVNYEKILKGDLSDFAGYWVNGNNGRIYLRPEGTTYFTGQRASGFRKHEGGTYGWSVGSEYGGFAVSLYPVGIKTENPPSYNVTSDATRVRLYAGHDAPMSSEEYYYRESEFPVTHIATENIRLREDQNLSAATLKVLEKGTKVLVQKWGNSATIDGNSARWAYVYTIDGYNGWCFSGYLR